MKHPIHTRILPAVTACALLFAACSAEEESASPKPSAASSMSPASSAAAAVSPTPEPPASKPSSSPSVGPSPSPVPSPSPSAVSSASPSATPKPTVKPVPAPGGASTKAVSWYYMKKKKGEVPGFPNEMKQLTPNQKVAWVGTGKKVYLTFDTGGPLGESDKLLQILRDNGVKATFFLVGYNVKQYKTFAKKVADEGHLIGNHTMTHKDLTTMSDDEVRKELGDFAQLIKDVTGKPVAPLFRFPYGAYSMHLLDLVSEMGYTSVFWSTAMKDWEPRANGAEDPYNDIMNGLHDGNVILMHQGSKENIEALERIIQDVRKAGYEFAGLEDLMK
ncbi:polysaccharide deacetylase family protein [Gorillibacterium sp. sgz5001074]|uniref:polysaccharide deacetylase family protein n=1 Tax=Gorillibacterium sp. sgz5001074 TaxID=3446695 RepID=UPI003F67A2DE